MEVFYGVKYIQVNGHVSRIAMHLRSFITEPSGQEGGLTQMAETFEQGLILSCPKVSTVMNRAYLFYSIMGGTHKHRILFSVRAGRQSDPESSPSPYWTANPSKRKGYPMC